MAQCEKFMPCNQKSASTNPSHTTHCRRSLLQKFHNESVTSVLRHINLWSFKIRRYDVVVTEKWSKMADWDVIQSMSWNS